MGDRNMFEKVYQDLLQRLMNGKELALLTFLDSKDEKRGNIKNKIFLNKHDIEKNLPKMIEDNKDIKEKVLHSFKIGTPTTITSDDKTVVIEPFFPKPRLIILGGGHIAKPLCELGNKVGFSVVVADDRPSFANANRFPLADNVICENFERVFDNIKLRDSDFIVIVTRGHRHDGVCLRNTLKYDPAYIGMIGSKRRVKEMMNQLIDEGFSKHKLDKVNSPIGLSIGAVTPDEIAISIIAEVISYRRSLGAKISNNNKFNWPEFDVDVINEACKESEIPRALITIINSKGSVPRKAGAKMIVWLDGRIMGSIGGGCSEANIITLARDAIIKNEYSIEHVDMTGDVAEDEGMVCGGILDVLIEPL